MPIVGGVSSLFTESCSVSARTLFFFAAVLAVAGPTRADEVSPGILPIIVEKEPKKGDKDRPKLAALRSRIVKELTAARPDLVDLAEGEEPVIGKPAKGLETLVSTYEGLATHLIAFESQGKGKRLTLTVSVVVVDTRAVLAKTRVTPFGANGRTAIASIREKVLNALPTTASAPRIDVETPAIPVEPSAIEAEAPVIAAATENAPTTAIDDDDESGGALWPWVTGGVVGLFAVCSASALASGAVFGVLALLDSNAFVASPTRTDLKESSLLKGNVADALYAIGGLMALAAGGALAIGLIIGFADDE
jgi:hypothetical protein